MYRVPEVMGWPPCSMPDMCAARGPSRSRTRGRCPRTRAAALVLAPRSLSAMLKEKTEPSRCGRLGLPAGGVVLHDERVDDAEAAAVGVACSSI